ncbi:hypothetical protein GCM10008968_10740 [Bacillus horti]
MLTFSFILEPPALNNNQTLIEAIANGTTSLILYSFALILIITVVARSLSNRAQAHLLLCD